MTATVDTAQDFHNLTAEHITPEFLDTIPRMSDTQRRKLKFIAYQKEEDARATVNDLYCSYPEEARTALWYGAFSTILGTAAGISAWRVHHTATPEGVAAFTQKVLHTAQKTCQNQVGAKVDRQVEAIKSAIWSGESATPISSDQISVLRQAYQACVTQEANKHHTPQFSDPQFFVPGGLALMFTVVATVCAYRAVGDKMDVATKLVEGQQWKKVSDMAFKQS